MTSDPTVSSAPVDASAAYALWDELFAFGLKLALSTASGTEAEQQTAWARLLRAHKRSLDERDAMWLRIFARVREAEHGR